MLIGLWLLLGLSLGAGFLAFARNRRVREPQVLGTGLIVAGLIYLGFALARASLSWIALELVGVLLCCALAWLGMHRSRVWLAVGWALHPLWDGALHLSGAGAIFAPRWYVITCLSFDLLVAVGIACARSRELEATLGREISDQGGTR
jgi:hypothetical protein